ncbi:uncharacterized protein LOC121784577 [Salvia splendens]|uniref:uncharacterized protein LOC121784577 n=1 Tax=Salvia splendens TaxID=180675 RepID=UPI001C2784DB|nr:uncharacterized protein LOC121784577 [Salvia splendens]
MGSRTESGVVTFAGVIRGLEQFTASSGSLDSTAMAFEHLLASLARVEARFDAMERRQNVAHPPPWPDPERRHNVALPPPWPDPDPDPPFDDWQRWRGDSARNRPMGPRKCQVIFDYFLDASLAGDSDFIEESLRDSERVQDEDTALCSGVQQALESPAYNTGRYSPSIDQMAMHHFHCLLHQNLST